MLAPNRAGPLTVVNRSGMRDCVSHAGKSPGGVRGLPGCGPATVAAFGGSPSDADQASSLRMRRSRARWTRRRSQLIEIAVRPYRLSTLRGHRRPRPPAIRQWGPRALPARAAH
jgi:hypothetical protein